jgi:serine/threonine protein kinase
LRLTVIILLALLFQQQHVFHVHRQSLAAKYSATKFDDDIETSRLQSWKLEDEDPAFQHDLLANREKWEVLGEGWEGRVFVYGDSVIKTFTPGRSPFRNCAPRSIGGKWPTEIAASLLVNHRSMRFAGHNENQNHSNNLPETRSGTALDGFVSVKAYFQAPSLRGTGPEWYLVTELIKGGSLRNLSKRVAQDPQARTYRELDARFRSAFERLVINLSQLHRAGYCHDDIKPENIFTDEVDWLLGDLGNMRQISHPYHSSRLWLRDNEQLEDCRANDIIRALKSYMQFIRMTASDRPQFDEDFIEGRHSLHELFHRASRNAKTLTATHLLRNSRAFDAEHPDEPFAIDRINDELRSSLPPSLLGFFSRKLALGTAVNHAIRTKIEEKMARFYAMTWVFGVPELDFCYEPVPAQIMQCDLLS